VGAKGPTASCKNTHSRPLDAELRDSGDRSRARNCAGSKVYVTTKDKQIDASVREVMHDQSRASSGKGPDVAKEERKKKIFASAALKAKEAKDERAFSELLRSVGVKDGSPEWKNAWKAFRSA
jgi:translation initiation factor 2 alpha subunit (eIF-2alpha)